jgi:hypothetical protein
VRVAWRLGQDIFDDTGCGFPCGLILFLDDPDFGSRFNLVSIGTVHKNPF